MPRVSQVFWLFGTFIDIVVFLLIGVVLDMAQFLDLVFVFIFPCHFNSVNPSNKMAFLTVFITLVFLGDLSLRLIISRRKM